MDQMLTDMAGLRTLRGEVSAMWMAAANNEMELVRTLAQVSPDVQNGNGDTPLRIAAFLGHRDVVSMLLEHAGPRARLGVPPVDSARTVAGRTACEWAREQGHTEVAAMLERDLVDQFGEAWGAAIRQRDEEASTAAAKAQAAEIAAQEAEERRAKAKHEAELRQLEAERLLELELELELQPEPEPDLEPEPEPELDEEVAEEVRGAALAAWEGGSSQPKVGWAEDDEGSPQTVTSVQVMGKFGRRLRAVRVAALKDRVQRKVQFLKHLNPTASATSLRESIREIDPSVALKWSKMRKPLVTTCVYFVVYLGMMAMLFAAPGMASAVTVWSVVALAGMLKKLLGPDHVPNWLWAVWLYLTLLFALPATLMANTDTLGHRVADLGGKGFLFMLWVSGWIFLWVMTVSGRLANPTKYLKNEKTGEYVLDEKTGEKKVDYEAQMTSMPTALPFKIKLLTVAYEGYTYSGFSFFPALPWSEIDVPDGMLEPQDVMMFGMVEFGGAVKHYTVLVTVCVMVVLAFMIQLGVWKFGKEGQKILAIEMCFDALAFPVIKQFTGVFACTETSSWRIDEETGVAGTACELEPCNAGDTACEASMKTACMDIAPTIGCFSSTHLWQIFAIMLLFVPYFLLGLGLRSYAQSLSSAVVIDGVFAIVAFQLKVFLAIAASAFGDCYPEVVIGSVEFAVITMLILNCKRKFSNVLSLNAVRLIGLASATVNGLYAAYISYKHDKRPCGTQETITRDAESTSTNVSYFDFFGLVVVNVSVLTFGWMEYERRRRVLDHKGQDTKAGKTGGDDVENSEKDAEARDWLDTSTHVYDRLAKSPDAPVVHYSQKYINDGQIGPPNDRVLEVDYPIIRNRLQRLAQWQQAYTYGEFEKSTGTLTVQRKRLGRPFQVYLTEAGDGQAIEDVTLDMILWSKHPTQTFSQRAFGMRGKDDFHVDGMDLQFVEVNANEVGGERLLDKLKKVRAIPTGPLRKFTKPKALSHHTSIKFANSSPGAGAFVARGEEVPEAEKSIKDTDADKGAKSQFTAAEARSMLFVGGLKGDMEDPDELRQLFADFGEVVDVDIRRDEGGSKLPWAVVKYANDGTGQEGARLAVEAAERLRKKPYRLLVKTFDAQRAASSGSKQDEGLPQVPASDGKSLGKDIKEAFNNLDNLLRVPDLKLLDISGTGYTLNDIVYEAKQRTVRDASFKWAITEEEIECFCPEEKTNLVAEHVRLQPENWGSSSPPGSPNASGRRRRAVSPAAELSSSDSMLWKQRGLRTLILDLQVGSHRHTVEIGPCGGCQTCPAPGCTGVRDMWKNQRKKKENVWKGEVNGAPFQVDYKNDVPIVLALEDAHGFLAPAPGKPAMTDLSVRIKLLLELHEHHADEEIKVMDQDLGPGDVVLLGNWFRSTKARVSTPSNAPNSLAPAESPGKRNKGALNKRQSQRKPGLLERQSSKFRGGKAEDETESGNGIGDFNAAALYLSGNPGILAHAADEEAEQKLRETQGVMAFEDRSSYMHAGHKMLTKPLARRKVVLDSWRTFCEGLKVPTTLTELHLAHISMGKEGALVLQQALEHMPSMTLLDVLANPLGTMGYLSIIGILERQAKDERGNVDADAGFNGVPNNVATVTNLRLGDTVATPRGNLKRVDCRLLAYELNPPAASSLSLGHGVGSQLIEIDLSQIFVKDRSHITPEGSEMRIPLSNACKQIIADAVKERKSPLHKLTIGMGVENHIIKLDIENDELHLDDMGLGSIDLELLSGWISHQSTVNKHKTINKLRKLSIGNNPNLVGNKTTRKRDVHLTHWKHFCEALSISKIYELGCSHIGMGPNAAVILAEIITDGTDYAATLQRLDILHNPIGDKGRAAIAAALYVKGKTTEPTKLSLLWLNLECDGELKLDATETDFAMNSRDMRPKDALLVGSWGCTRWPSLHTVDVSDNDKMFKMRVAAADGSHLAGSSSEESEDENQDDSTEDGEQRVFRVTVLQCRNLVNADAMGGNDDFVTLRPDRLPAVRTSTVEDGGVAPVWAGGCGETITFPDLHGLPGKLAVEVWDEDPGDDSANDMIGSGQIMLGDFDINKSEDWGRLDWFCVQRKGKPAGEVLLCLRWDASTLVDGKQAQGSSPLWHLTVDLLECNGLPKMDINAPNDPYVEVSVEGAKEKMLRSSTVYGGGANPKWLDGQGGERMLFELLEHPPSIGLVVYDEDKTTADDLVGDNLIELGKHKLHSAWKDTQTIEITDRKGRKRGTVTCKVSWGPAPQADYRLMCTVLAARNLASRDRVSENDVYVRASVNGAKRRTPTMFNSNNPEWNSYPDLDGRSRLLEWGLGTEAECITIEAWDHDKYSNDDLIGMKLIDLDIDTIAAQTADGEDPTPEWHQLTGKSNEPCGDVQLAFEWVVDKKGQAVVQREQQVQNWRAMKKAVAAMTAQRIMDTTGWTSGDHHGWKVFCAALGTSGVRSICVSGIEMGPEGAEELARCLPPSATELDVSRNLLRARGKAAIGTAITSSPMRKLTIDLGRAHKPTVLTRGTEQAGAGATKALMRQLTLMHAAEATADTDDVLAFRGADLQPEDINLLGCWTAEGAKATNLIQLSDNHDVFGEALSRTQRQMAANTSSKRGVDVFASARKSVRKLQLIRGLGGDKIDVRDTFEIAPPPEEAWKAWTHLCGQLATTGVRRLEVANIKMRLVAWQTLLESLGSLKKLTMLVLSENPICGPKRAPDMHLPTWKAFCEYVQRSGLTTLTLDRTGMGPLSANELLDAVRNRIDPDLLAVPTDSGTAKPNQVDPDILTWDEMGKLADKVKEESDSVIFTLSLRSNPGIVGELDQAGNLQAVDRLTPIKAHEGTYDSEWPDQTTWDRKRVPDAIKVSCPEGMGPGDRFKTITPAGDEITVQVPLGKSFNEDDENEQGDDFWVDLKTFEMQMLSWQKFCSRLAMVRVTVLDIRNIGMGPKAMDMLRDVIAHKCIFTESIEVLRIDSTGARTFSKDAISVTSDGLATQRKDYTLERCDTELDFRGKDFGPADIRLLATWLGLSRRGKHVTKLAFDTVGLSKFNADNDWEPPSIELNAEDPVLDLTGKDTGAADFELLASWMSLPQVARNLTKLSVEVIGGSRSVSTQAKPDTLGFLPDSTDPTLEDRSPPNVPGGRSGALKRHLFELDATKSDGDYGNLGLGDTDLILLAAWVKHIVSPGEDDQHAARVPMRRLNICGNPYHLDGAMVLAEVLAGSQLNEITLGNTDKPVIVPINDDLAVKLNFKSKQLKPPHAMLVCAAMSTNRNLVTVNLLRNNFGNQIEHIIDTLEHSCKDLRTVCGVEPDVIATSDMTHASSVVGQDLPEDRARFIQAAASKNVQLAFSGKSSMIERMKMKKEATIEFEPCAFEDAREPTKTVVVNNKEVEHEYISLQRTSVEPWPQPAKSGCKFACGRTLSITQDGRGRLQEYKDCLWGAKSPHKPKHSVLEPPFSCVEAGCTACTVDTGFHPDTPPEVTFDRLKDEQDTAAAAAVLAVAAEYNGDQDGALDEPTTLRPFGVPAELGHVVSEAYKYDLVEGGLETGGCWTPARMPSLVAHDPDIGKTIRMNGHKIRFSVQEFVAQGLGAEWYQMDAGELLCTYDEYAAARTALRTAARKAEVCSEKHQAAKAAQIEVNDSKHYMETMKTENILRQLKQEEAMCQEKLTDLEKARCPVTISGVVLRGHDWDPKTLHAKPGWVTEFAVSWSTDGDEWVPITHRVGEIELLSLFAADANPKTRVYFKKAITARYVRIHPTQWDNMDRPQYQPIAMCAGLVRAATTIDKGIRPCERWKDSNPVIEGKPLAGVADSISQPITVRVLSDECKRLRQAAWAENKMTHAIGTPSSVVAESTFPFSKYLEKVRASAVARNDSLTHPIEAVVKQDANLKAWEDTRITLVATPGSTRGGKRMLNRPEVPVPLGPEDMKLLALDIRLARATIAVQKVTLCGNTITGSSFGPSESELLMQQTMSADMSTQTENDEAPAEQEPGSPTSMSRMMSEARAKKLSTAEGDFDVDATGLRAFARSMGSSNITDLDVCGCALGKYAMSKMGMSGMFDRGKDKLADDAGGKAATHWDVVIERERELRKLDPSNLLYMSGRVEKNQARKNQIRQAEENLNRAFAEASKAFTKVSRTWKDAVELRCLNVSRNSYLLDGAEALAAVLRYTRLKAIIVGPRVPTLMPLKHTAESLDMAREDLDPADTIILASALATYHGLKSVNLLGEHSPNRLGDGGADALIDMYKTEAQLYTLLNLKDGVTSIDVSGRGVDAASAKVLATELECGRTTRAVTTINLSNNSFIQELLTKGSTVMQIGTGQSGVTLCDTNNSERPGSVRVSWDDNDATADWLAASELAVLPQTDSWERLCRSMMPRTVRTNSGMEIPAYGVPPHHAPGDAVIDEFYQLRFGARIFQLLTDSIYKKSVDYWDDLGIQPGDPVVVSIIEAPSTDLIEMLLRHVDEAQAKVDEALEKLASAEDGAVVEAEREVDAAKKQVLRNVADSVTADHSAESTWSYAKTSLLYKEYQAQLEADSLHVLYRKAKQVGLDRVLEEYSIGDPAAWMARFDGSMIWVQYQSQVVDFVGSAKKTVREANLAYEQWANRPQGSSGHDHLVQIDTVILDSVGMGPLGLRIFAENLSPQIHSLVLTHNDLLGTHNGRMELVGWQTFCAALEHSALQELDVSGCGLTCRAVEILANAVREMATRARQMRELLQEFTSRKAPEGDGEITMDELTRLAGRLELKLGGKALKFLFAEIDEDGSNSISVQEFSHWVESHTLKRLTIDSTGIVDKPQKYTLSVNPCPTQFESMSAEEQDDFKQQYGVWCYDAVQLSGKHISSADLELIASWQAKQLVHMTKIDLSDNRVTEAGVLSPETLAQAASPLRMSKSGALADQMQDTNHLIELKETLRQDAIERMGDSALKKSQTATEVAAVRARLDAIQLKQLQKEELGQAQPTRRSSPKRKTKSWDKPGSATESPTPGADDMAEPVAEDVAEPVAEAGSPKAGAPKLGAARKDELNMKLKEHFKLIQNISGKSAAFNASDLELYRKRVKEEAQNDGSTGVAHLGAWLDGDGGVEKKQRQEELASKKDRLASIERMIPQLQTEMEKTQVALDALDSEDDGPYLQEKLARDSAELASIEKEKAKLEKDIPKVEEQLDEIEAGKAYVDVNLSGCGLHGSAVANMLDGLSVSLISLDLSANGFTHQSKLKIAETLASLEDEQRHFANGGMLEIGTLRIDLGADREGSAISPDHAGVTDAHGPCVLHVADRSISLKRWGLGSADQIILGSWLGMAGPQSHLTKLDISGNLLTVEGAQALAKHIKSSKLQQIVLGHDVPFAVHDAERKLLLTTEEKDATSKVFVSTRNLKGATSSGSELLSAADAVMLAPILETLPAVEVVSLRGNLDITGGTGPIHARQYGQEMIGWNALCKSWTDPSVLPNLKKLDLSKCGLDNYALEQLAPVLQRKGTEAQLEELALSDNDALIGKEMDKKALGSVKLEEVSKQLAESLWVRGGNITGWKSVLRSLTYSKIRALYVDNCRLGDHAFHILSKDMTNMSELRELSIWRNKLSLKAAGYMGEALMHHGKVNSRVKLQRLIFGSDANLRPVRNGDGEGPGGVTESGLQTYSHVSHDFDFSPPTDGVTDGLNQARIAGGGRLVGGSANGFPVYPYDGQNAPSPDNVEYGDGLMLVYAIYTSADNRGAAKSHLHSLDLRCIPLNTEAKKLLGQVVEHSCLRKLSIVLGQREASFDVGNSDSSADSQGVETLDLSHHQLQSDDLYVLTGWLAHDPQCNSRRKTPKIKRLCLNHNMSMINNTELADPGPAWAPFCKVLGASDIVTVELDLTRLGHPRAVAPLAEAMRMMSEVTVLSVKGNDIAPEVLTTLESSSKGGPPHRISFFELHSGDV